MRKTSLEAVHKLAKEDERVLYIGSDPGPGTLNAMKEEFPERFFIEGIAEAHCIGMAAGLAMEGYIPYVNTIANFLTRRAFEQILIDIALHELPIRLIGNGGGLVYAPLGPTHTALDDIALMRMVPGMTILAPSDANEMARLMPQTINHSGPIYIRLAKGGDPVISNENLPCEIGRSVPLKNNTSDNVSDVLIISTGIMTGRALTVADMLSENKLRVIVQHCHTIKPIDNETIKVLANKTQIIVTIEEHRRFGGLGSAVLECLADEGILLPVVRLGIPDIFTRRYGSQNSLLCHYDLDPDAITKQINNSINKYDITPLYKR
jgi:transketolase